MALGNTLCGPGVSGEANCPPDNLWAPDDDYWSAESSTSSVIWNYGGQSPWVEGYVYSTHEWATQLFYGVPLNTLSYKGTWMKECDPVLDPGELDLDCADNNDAVYVDDATFESEGQVPNLACSLSPRTGLGIIDRNYTCFTSSLGLSTLPSWYLDTTFFDDWQLYNASIGSLAPETIIEGNEYYAYVQFWAWGNTHSPQ